MKNNSNRIVAPLFFTILTLFGVSDISAQNSQQEAGIDLFIKACQNCGWNPNLISSIQLEYDEKTWNAVYSIPPTYSAEMLEQMLSAYDGDVKARDESLRLSEEARKKRAVEGFSCSSKVVYRIKNMESFLKSTSTQKEDEQRRFVFRGLQHRKNEELVHSVFWGYESGALSVNKTLPFAGVRHGHVRD
jgi:hypothetical protein